MRGAYLVREEATQTTRKRVTMTYSYNPSLYQLSQDHEELLYMLLDPDADEQTIIDTIESLESLIEHKAEGYGHIINTLNARAEQLKAEETRLAGMRAKAQRRIEYLRSNLKAAMQQTGLKKLETEHYSISIAKNGGKLPLVFSDEASVPDEYLVPDFKPDTDKIRADLEAGKHLPFASLAERGEGVRIR